MQDEKRALQLSPRGRWDASALFSDHATAHPPATRPSPTVRTSAGGGGTRLPNVTYTTTPCASRNAWYRIVGVVATTIEGGREAKREGGRKGEGEGGRGRRRWGAEGGGREGKQG